jgi:hypothetical protein
MAGICQVGTLFHAAQTSLPCGTHHQMPWFHVLSQPIAIGSNSRWHPFSVPHAMVHVPFVSATTQCQSTTDCDNKHPLVTNAPSSGREFQSHMADMHMHADTKTRIPRQDGVNNTDILSISLPCTLPSKLHFAFGGSLKYTPGLSCHCFKHAGSSKPVQHASSTRQFSKPIQTPGGGGHGVLP